MSNLVKLGDCVEILTGRPFKSSGYTDDSSSSIRLLRGDNIGNGILRWEGVKCWPSDQIEGCEKYHLQVGDVVIAMDRPWIASGLKYAEVNSTDIPSLLVQRVARLRARLGLHQRYLKYLIGSKSFTSYILGVQTGTAVPHISATQIKGFSFALPDFKTQESIASLLGALDDKIAVNDRIAVTARTLGQAHFAAELEGGAQDAELSQVVSVLVRGVAPKYSEDATAVTVINQKCVRNGHVNLEPARRTLREKIKEPKFLQRYDVLVNSTGVGTLGRVAIWDHDGEATVDSHVTIVRFDADKVDPLCAGMAMLRAQQDIELLGEGSTGQTELSRKQLNAYRITIPSNEAMRNLRPQLDALEARGKAALDESTALAALRDTLLPKLMSGEIRVRDAEKVVEDAV